VSPKFKLISSSSLEAFEERLNDFMGSLDRDDVIVDVKFSTASRDGTVEYSALVHYQRTEAWD
jgi:hypothetical protein